MRFPSPYGLAPLLIALALGAGCGKKAPGAARRKVLSQPPRARPSKCLNADEITVHQVNSILAQSPNVTPEVAGKAKREILDRLIDQQLARQKAVEKKLDRTPNVMRAIEAAPVDEPTATPHIQQFLFNQRLAQAIAKEMVQNKEKSKIEYIGEFANAAPATTAKPAAKAEPAQPAQPPGPNFAKYVPGLLLW